MIKNYFKIAFRNFSRNRAFWLLNISGLAVGLACCLLIGLFITDELSYDKYHSNADRIFRVTTEFEDRNGESIHSASSIYALAPAIRDNIDGVEHVVRFFGNPLSSTTVKHGNNQLNVDGIWSVDAEVFQIFDFELLSGNPVTALQKPYTLVISESAARTFFGEGNPIGEIMAIGSQEYEVTGVMADVPQNSHLTFDYLRSFATIAEQSHFQEQGWNLQGFYTYLLMEEETDRKAVARQINTLRGGENQTTEYAYHLQPLTDIHLRSHLSGELQPNSDIRYIYLFGTIALLLLIIACINYINLTTAIANQYVHQVGVRKLMGAENQHIFWQFLAESVVIGMVATIMAFFLIEISMPWFNQITQKSLALDFVGFGLALPLTALIIGFLAGIYPALIYTRIHPYSAIRREFFTGATPDGGFMRKGLVVFQFAVSISLIISTITVQKQLDYVQEGRLGFDKDNLVILHSAERVKDHYDVLKETLMSYSGIQKVTTSTNIPGQLIFNEFRMNSENEPFYLAYNNVDPDFVETLGLDIARGRNYSAERGTDAEKAILVNETTVRKLGWENPLEETLFNREVIGVVRDYLVRSAQEEVPASTYVLSEEPQRFIAVRIGGGDILATIDHIEQTWSEFDPSRPLEYTFMDSDIEMLYRSEERLARVFITFTLLTIFVACLGLFGLAAYAAVRRTKEIGIRKVLGASITNIIALLSKDFIRLVVIGFVIAIPITWYAMNQWLADFAYRIEIGPGIFALAGGVAIVIVLFTVSWQSIKAAVANPVESLRSE